jgi:hypothetical protein
MTSNNQQPNGEAALEAKPMPERLVPAQRAMLALAEHFHRKGVVVRIPRLKDEPENIMWVGMQRVLVRALMQSFTCAADWPYHKGFIFVANDRATVDRAGDTIGAYAAVSGDLKYAAVVRLSTRPRWIDQGAYACPLEHVEWIKLMNREALGE